MNAISEKLERLLLSMGLTSRQIGTLTESKGWDLVFALRHPRVWAQRRKARSMKSPDQLLA